MTTRPARTEESLSQPHKSRPTRGELQVAFASRNTKGRAENRRKEPPEKEAYAASTSKARTRTHAQTDTKVRTKINIGSKDVSALVEGAALSAASVLPTLGKPYTQRIVSCTTLHRVHADAHS
ncbi:hypothetical protein MRX96_042049 [Rhipicephalus microplus]